MPVSATGRYMNWLAPTFTPATGSPIILDGVTNIQVDEGGSVVKFAGDTDRSNSLMVNDFNEPVITITFANAAKALQLRTGTIGTFTVTQLDAVNGSTPGGGALLYTMTNAIAVKPTATGAYRKIADNSVQLQGYDPAGTANALVVTTV